MGCLEQFPGPVFIRPNRLLQFAMATVALAISVALAFVPANGWAIALSASFGCLALFSFYVASLDNYLKLDAEGFQYKWSFKKLKRYSWTQVSNFEAYRGPGGLYVRRAVDKYVKFDDGTPYYQRAWGPPKIPLPFSFDVEELANLMNRWREQALANSKIPTANP